MLPERRGSFYHDQGNLFSDRPRHVVGDFNTEMGAMGQPSGTD